MRNGGKYDGRLGILVPMACVRELHRAGRRLPFGIEVVGFAEEEGQRYKATFLGSGALTGHFDPAWLDQQDADGVTMREAMRAAGLPATLAAIPALQRDPARYLGFVEVHIEQGPVLERARPAAGRGHLDQRQRALPGRGRRHGQPRRHHADGPPPRRRLRGGRAGAVRREARRAPCPTWSAPSGMLEVPAARSTWCPGRCRFSLDLRATTNAARDALAADVLAELAAHLRARAACTHTLEERCAPPPRPAPRPGSSAGKRAVSALGLPVFRMPSGAGHDAMKLHEVMPQAMLFMRGGNAGISHNPLETITNDDTELCVARLPAPARPTGPTHDRMTAYEQLDAWIDAHFDEEVRFLQDLVQVPTDTPPGNNAPHAERTAELLAALRLAGREAPGAGAGRCRPTGCSRSPT